MSKYDDKTLPMADILWRIICNEMIKHLPAMMMNSKVSMLLMAATEDRTAWYCLLN